MGTRSLTRIYDEDTLLLAIYKQSDGYIEDWGTELKDFVKNGKFVNGISLEDVGTIGKVFNGIGDFAFQLVLKFKEGVGEIYATTEDNQQEYNYIVRYIHARTKKEKDKIEIKCLESGRRNNYNEIIEVV